MGRRIAIGVQTYDKIIENNCFYIDKTYFIKDWWESRNEVTLIARPRRFAKVELPIDADKYEEFLKEKVKKSIEEQGQKEFTGTISDTAGTLIDRWSVNW